MEVMLQLVDITKSFDGKQVLHDICLAVPRGEIVCLLGASGCGKSTLLRIVAGLETADSGRVLLNGGSLEDVPVHRRGFGLMFQEFALFPHKTVGDNIAFGLRMAGLSKADTAARLFEILDVVGLVGYEGRDIGNLSGGERQRVALARSIAPRPKLLMLDEPLGSLDRILREQLSVELRDIIKRLDLTAVSVTHDQTEAFSVADRIVLLHDGRIEQHGTPRELYEQPATRYAAQFMGLNNIVEGRVVCTHEGLVTIQTAMGKVSIASTGRSFNVNQIVQVVVRPEASLGSGERANCLVVDGRVIKRTFRGSTERIVLQHAGGATLELDVERTPAEVQIRLALEPLAMSILG